jgi:hypothetical protein
MGSGTVILNAPTGFVFDATGSAPTLTVTHLSGGGGGSDATASGPTRTSTSISFTITQDTGSIKDEFTWGNIRVRPSAGTPLANGTIGESGTATVAGGFTNWGTLAEVVGAANKLVYAQAPVSTVYGNAISPTVTVDIVDQFGNLRTSDTTSVTLGIHAGTGTGGAVLNGGASTPAVGGVATFSTLTINKAGTAYELDASATGLTTATSGAFNITARPITVTAVTGGNQYQDL